MSICYLNGVFLPLAEASIPVLDRGFIFGDGIYEVIPVFGGRPFRLDQHLNRFEGNLREVRIGNPLPRSAWESLLAELVCRNDGAELSLYLQVTRGVAPRDHAFPDCASPTVFVMARPVVRVAEPAPVCAITAPDIRWSRCDIKTTSLLANVLLRNDARAAGAYEAILVRDGEITEGAASNVFVVVDGGVVKTPPKSRWLLPGITRDLLVEILAPTPMPVCESVVTIGELRAADEVWLTSSNGELVPVVSLDGAAVGQGAPGDCFRRARAHYRRYRDGPG